MVVGFFANLLIGFAAYHLLGLTTRLRKIDAAAVAGHYGSDSAGTFVTCVGVLTASHIAFASYMPVLLAIMEIPGCLLALVIASRLRRRGLDAAGNMPGEAGYAGIARTPLNVAAHRVRRRLRATTIESKDAVPQPDLEQELVAVAEAGGSFNGHAANGSSDTWQFRHREDRPPSAAGDDLLSSDEETAELDLEPTPGHSRVGYRAAGTTPDSHAGLGKLLHEVFLNPGTFLLFGGLTIGFISRQQGEQIVANNDTLFVSLFQGMLCLFLLEMGMTAAKRLKDLKAVGWRFVAFGIIAPNLFAMTGIALAHLYGMLFGYHFEVGTYVLFAVLCASASYIAVPAIQRLAIPEASPTLPLTASLGLTFTYNVTIGIPVYIMAATTLTTYLPVVALG